MSNETIIIGNILASILHPIYYCLFMTFTKEIKTKQIYFLILTIIDYVVIQNCIKFTLGINANLFLAITFYINLKFLYKNKARITDITTFIMADILLGIISIIGYFIFGMSLASLIFATIMPIIIVILLSNKLNKIENFYNKYWNRSKIKKKIKSITVRGIGFSITVLEFLALHFWMIYLLLK